MIRIRKYLAWIVLCMFVVGAGGCPSERNQNIQPPDRSDQPGTPSPTCTPDVESNVPAPTPTSTPGPGFDSLIVVPELPTGPVLHLELGTLTTDREADEQRLLMLDLTRETAGRALEDVMASGLAAAEHGPLSTLLLELKMSASDEDADKLAASFGNAGASGPSPTLVLELNPMSEEVPSNILTARLSENPAMLLLEMEPMSGDALEEERNVWDQGTTLLLELDTIASDNFSGLPDTLLLQLEALQGGAAFRQISDFAAHRLAGYAPSLIGHWRLTEGEGAIAWDYSDNLNDGTIHNLYWTSDGLRFDDDGYIEIPYDASLNAGEALTMALWVYLDDVAASQRILGKLDPQNPLGYLLEIHPSTGLTGFENLSGLSANPHARVSSIIYTNDSNAWGDVWGAIPVKTWTHVAVTWERGGDMIGYINGVEAGRIAAGDAEIGSGTESSLFIGADSQHAANVHGVLADLRLYDVPLSAAAIRTLATGWTAESPKEPGGGGTDDNIDSGGTDPGNGDGAKLGSSPAAPDQQNPEFEITEEVLKRLKAEGVDQKIVDALRTLQDQRFQGTANNQYVLVTTACDTLFDSLLKEPLQNLPKNQDGSFTITDKFLQNQDFPADVRTALQKLRGDSYSTPEKLSDAVKTQVKKLVQDKVLPHLQKHASVQQEFMVTDTLLAKCTPKVRDTLAALKHKRFLSEDAFKEAVGADVFDAHKNTFRQEAIVKAEFTVTPEALQSWEKSLQTKLQGLAGQ